jgi:hypothetical protein
LFRKSRERGKPFSAPLELLCLTPLRESLCFSKLRWG